MEKEPAGAARLLRHGVGKILVASGGLSCAVMGASAYHATGHWQWLEMPVRGWTDMYKSAYFLMLLGGALYLLKAIPQTPEAVRETIYDFVLGVAGYTAILVVVMGLLVTGWLTPWLSIAPGLALGYYGWRLWDDRPFWKH